MVLYTNPKYSVVINVNGGCRAYAVLARLGFKNEFETAVEERQVVRKEKAKEFFDKCKKKKEEHKAYLEKVKEETKND